MSLIDTGLLAVRDPRRLKDLNDGQLRNRSIRVYS